MPDPGPALQVVALSLPAVALYMGVLSDLYNDATLARKRYPDPESEAFESPGPNRCEVDHKVHREFVTLTTAMDGWDFRLATLSLVGLSLSAVFLLPSMTIPSETLYWIGILCATIGFNLLVAALVYTAYASFFEKYPNSPL